MARDNAVTKKIKASAMKETRSPLPSSSYRLTDNTSRLNRSRFARFFTPSPFQRRLTLQRDGRIESSGLNFGLAKCLDRIHIDFESILTALHRNRINRYYVVNRVNVFASCCCILRLKIDFALLMNATIEFPTLNYGDTLCVSIPSVYISCTEANFLYPFLVEKTRKYFRKEELMFYFYICCEKYRNDLKLSSAFNI